MFQSTKKGKELDNAVDYVQKTLPTILSNANKNIADLDINKADKAEIPNVSTFITKDVNNLTNYYDKANVDTKIGNKQNVLTVTPDLIKTQNEIGVNGNNVIRFWQPNILYKVGDIAVYIKSGGYVQLLKCTTQHLSPTTIDYTPWEKNNSIEHSYGAVTSIYATYAEEGGGIDNSIKNKVAKAFKTGSSTVYKELTDNNYTDTDKQNVADCTTAKHTHNNKAVIDKITDANIATWDAKQDRQAFETLPQTSVTLIDNTQINLGTPISITLSLPTTTQSYKSTIIFNTVDTTIPFIIQSDIRFSGVDCDEDYYFIPTPHKKYRIDFYKVENEIWGDVKARLDPVPYLRDGLTCWFDGILNKQDYHDTITSYWYDRAAQANKNIYNFGYSVDSVEQIYWKEKCLYSKNNGNGKSVYIKTGLYSSTAKIKSFEIVLKNIGRGTIHIGSQYGNNGYETNTKALFSINEGHIMIWSKDKNNANKTLAFYYNNFNVRHTYTFTLSDFDTVNSRVYCYLYIDGVKTNTYTLNDATQENAYFKVESVLGSGWETNEFETYSLRLYNKQLTDSQITSHFQIDSKRFK